MLPKLTVYSFDATTIQHTLFEAGSFLRDGGTSAFGA